MKIIKTYESYNLEIKKRDFEDFTNRIDEDFLLKNSDGTYDYYGDLNLSYMNLDYFLEIPYKFRKINGNFDCSNNSFKSLKDSPEIITGNFDCSDNRLISLQYLPKEIGGIVECWKNQLLSIKGLNNNFKLIGQEKNPFGIFYEVIYTVKNMSFEQQMAELKFFDENDPKASKMLQEILFDLGVDFGTHRKEMFQKTKEKDLGHLGL